jgi:hypothetical protein
MRAFPGCEATMPHADARAVGRRHTIVAIAVSLLLALFSLNAVTAPADAAPTRSILYLCVKKANPGKGLSRIVAKRTRCTRGERKLIFRGVPGLPGPAGPAGSAGAVGPTGPAGPAGGPAGPAGPAGPIGPVGPTGPAGPQGPAGEDGQDGTDGATGPTGAQGPAGADGQDGTDGATGPTGPQGPAGTDGQDGADGATGPTGPEGPIGPTGPTGATGATGPTGPAGADAVSKWAVINTTGTAARSSQLTSSTRSGTGSYLLTFDSAVNTCAFVTTPASVNAPTTFSDTRIGFAEAVTVTGETSQVRVFTADKGGSQADRAFHIAVLC